MSAFRVMIAISALLCSIPRIGAAAARSSATTGSILSSIQLSRAFRARLGWRFTAVQGPQVPDPLGEASDKAPGVIRLCVSPDGRRTCRPSLGKLLANGDRQDLFSQPHFLDDARIVHPRPDLPLLLIQVASLHSGDGDQRVATTALAYDRTVDSFTVAYAKQTGQNNNQEIRYIEAGPLRGAIISAEPTSDAPFAFWVTVNKIGAGDRYREALRYRSATRYNDGTLCR